MKSVMGRLATMVAVGFTTGLFAVSGARASDIVCKAPAAASSVRCNDPRGAGMRCTLATDTPRARQQHLICDSTRLSERYERLYAEQQRMVRKGIIRQSDVAAWRARRDGCDSVRCLESMFSRFWRERDATRNAPGRPVSVPPAARAMSTPATHEPAPATTPTQRAEEEPASTSTESLAMQVSPAPIEVTRPSATPVETPAAPRAVARPVAKNMSSGREKSYPAALALESLFSGLGILGMGAGFLWTRRTVGVRNRPRSAIPAAMVIAYGLLFVNALLLPFTLALK